MSEGLTPEAARRRRLVIFSVVTLLVATGALIYFGLRGRKPAARWVTAPVTRGEVAQVVSATGTLQPVVLSPVGSQVSGIVWKIHADYNSQVKKGQTLVELDPALFQTAVKREEANLAAAQAQVAKARADATNASVNAKRARELAGQHFIALSERDTAIATEASTRAAFEGAEAGVKLATAALDKAKLDLKNSVVLSPVDGIVIARSVELGQAVVASFQAPNLFTIAEDLRKMQVLANVDEADIGFMKIGTTAQFTVDSFRNRKFTAKVAQVRNAAQTVQNVVTYVVVLDVDNGELLLRPGMTANVRLDVARRESAVLIPSSALRFKPKLDRPAGAAGGEGGAGGGAGGRGAWRKDRDKDKDKEKGKDKDKEAGGDEADRGVRATVFIPDGEGLKPARIRVGITDGNNTEVVSGLEEGQTVIVDVARAATTPGPTGSPMMPGMPRPGGGGGGGMRRGGF